MSRSHWIPKVLFLRNDPNKGCFGKTTLPRPQVIFVSFVLGPRRPGLTEI